MKSCSSVRATVKTEVRSVTRAAVVALGVAVALCAVCSPGTGFIVLWSQSSAAGSGVRWWRQCLVAKAASSRAGPKLAGKPVEVGRGGLISRQKSSRVWNNGMEWQACGPLGWEISLGLPKGLSSVGPPSLRPTVLSVPSSPTARLVLSFFSFSRLPATFVSRQLTGSSRGPLWSTVIFREHRRRPVSVPRLGEYALPNARGSTSATVASCTRYTALLHSISATLANVAVRLRSTNLVFSHSLQFALVSAVVAPPSFPRPDFSSRYDKSYSKPACWEFLYQPQLLTTFQTPRSW